LDRKFNEDSISGRKTVILSLSMGLTSNFVPDYQTAPKLQKSDFRKVFLQYSIQNVFLAFLTVVTWLP